MGHKKSLYSFIDLLSSISEPLLKKLPILDIFFSTCKIFVTYILYQK